MNELLKKLFESELLTDDSKKELTEAFEATINEAVEAAKSETEVKVRAELTEQFVIEKEAIVEAMDTKIEELLEKHVAEFNEDVDNFRDLETEFATRLIEAKAEIAETVKHDMAELIDQLDAFNTKCLEEEFAEFEASINEVKQIQFGKEIFEAVAKTFEAKFADSNDTLNQLKEAEEKLEVVQKSLTESATALNAAKRKEKLDEVLSALQGRPREVMEAILKTTATNKLEETYDKFIGKVLHDASNKESEKESAKSPVLAEGKETDIVEEVVLATGNTEKLDESAKDVNTAALSKATLARIQRLAGNDD
jgi:hypothetical protein